MIKYNTNTINDLNFDDANVIKIYRNNAVCYYKLTTSGGTTSQTPCFAVVDNISQYSDTEFEDVYNNADGKWYKLNNLNQYEKYGVYASGRTECSGGTPTSRLPQGYTEVEYVQNNTQGAYLNLGVKLYETIGNSYQITARYKSQYMSNWSSGEYLQTIINSEGVSSPYYGMVFRYAYNTHVLELAGGDKSDITWTNTDNGDGTSALTISSNSTAHADQVPLGLFASYQGNYTTPYRWSNTTIYSMQITLNNELVRDLVPCIRDNDSMVGMYDLVNDVFYYPPNYQSYQLVAGYPITPTVCVTTYEGKLTIDEGYEYIYSGGSWVNVGEVSGSTYPLYYAEKSDPPDNLSFSSMTEAEEYECPWVGMQATIDGVSYIFSGDSISGYEWVMNEPIDYSTHYLTLVAQADNVTFGYSTATSSNKLQYSTDSGTTWNDLANGRSTTSVNNGDKVMFKASGLTVNTERGIGKITPSASATVEGNIMSIAYGDDFSGQTVIPNNYQFRKLFSGVTTITSAENMVLPATTVKQQCYSQMFQGCSNLVTAPKVIGSSAMTWSGDYCWSDMFNSCTSLTTAPQLPALNLGTQCYWYMFQNCTSLTTAPELLATTTATQCYNGMFSGCISLNYIKVMSSNGFNMSDWVKDVASSGTFVKSSTATFSSCGQNTYPCNWTVQNA